MGLTLDSGTKVSVGLIKYEILWVDEPIPFVSYFCYLLLDPTFYQRRIY